MKILIALAFVIAALLLIRIIEMLIRYFAGKRQSLKFLIRFFPLFELISVLVITFNAIDYLFSESNYYKLIMMSLIISFIAFISWFLIKDLIAGIIFRTGNNFRSGSAIQIGETKGKMLKMRASHIIIETHNGRTVKIPYSRVANETISEHSEEWVRADSLLVIKIAKNMSWRETEIKLKNILLTTPWRLLGSKPLIKLLTDEGQFFEVEIQLKTRNSKYVDNLFLLLSRKFEIQLVSK